MKKIVILALLLMISLSGCVNTKNRKQDCVRIHIRANSNSEIDQSVKLDVRDAVVNYLTPLLSDCKSSDDAKEVIRNNLGALKKTSDESFLTKVFLTARPCGSLRKSFLIGNTTTCLSPRAFTTRLSWNLAKEREIIGGACVFRRCVSSPTTAAKTFDTNRKSLK